MTQVILIVDDDPLIRKLITTTLDDVSDSRLLEAGDGVQALETALRERPQIVFLDYDMPRMGGVETCRRLRSDPATADATIVMLTAMADAPAKDRATAGRRRPLPHQAVLPPAPPAARLRARQRAPADALLASRRRACGSG